MRYKQSLLTRKLNVYSCIGPPNANIGNLIWIIGEKIGDIKWLKIGLTFADIKVAVRQYLRQGMENTNQVNTFHAIIPLTKKGLCANPASNKNKKECHRMCKLWKKWRRHKKIFKGEYDKTLFIFVF